MKIRFADSRPSGDYALVLPVAGKDRSVLATLGSSQAAVSSALDRHRFEGEASSASEQFVQENGAVRRVLIVGTGSARAGRRRRRKVGRDRCCAPADVRRASGGYRYFRPRL